MKKYPKNLAEITVKAETVNYLYEKAEKCEFKIEEYSKRVEEGDDSDWIFEELNEATAKMDAYIQLAEKLAKTK